MAVNVNASNEGYQYGSANLCGGFTELTVAITINQTGTGINSERLCGQWATVGTYPESYSFLLQNSSNLIGFVVMNEGGTSTANFRAVRTTTTDLASAGLKRVVTTFTTTGPTMKIWMNGSERSTNPWFTGNITTINSQTVGQLYCGYDADAIAGVDGDYSEFAVWSSRLTDEACLALSNGVSPRLFPIDRVFYAPLINTSWPHDMHGRTGSANGTPTDAAHERFFYPRRRFISNAGRTYSFVDDSLVRDRMVPGGAYVNEDGAGLVHRQIPGSAYLNEGAVTTRTAQQGQSPGGPYVQYTR